MAGIVRKGDSSYGHQSYPPMSNIEGSDNVFVNGIPVHRVGDSWPSHKSSVYPYPSHAGVAASGSATVFANGKAICRIGDSVNCGSIMASGSDDVFCN